jgi:hypothetical protein
MRYHHQPQHCQLASWLGPLGPEQHPSTRHGQHVRLQATAAASHSTPYKQGSIVTQRCKRNTQQLPN